MRLSDPDIPDTKAEPPGVCKKCYSVTHQGRQLSQNLSLQKKKKNKVKLEIRKTNFSHTQGAPNHSGSLPFEGCVVLHAPPPPASGPAVSVCLSATKTPKQTGACRGASHGRFPPSCPRPLGRRPPGGASLSRAKPCAAASGWGSSATAGRRLPKHTAWLRGAPGQGQRCGRLRQAGAQLQPGPGQLKVTPLNKVGGSGAGVQPWDPKTEQQS